MVVGWLLLKFMNIAHSWMQATKLEEDDTLLLITMDNLVRWNACAYQEIS